MPRSKSSLRTLDLVRIDPVRSSALVEENWAGDAEGIEEPDLRGGRRCSDLNGEVLSDAHILGMPLRKRCPIDRTPFFPQAFGRDFNPFSIVRKVCTLPRSTPIATIVCET